MLDKLNLTDPIALIIAIIIVVFIVLEVINGYKKGFLESGVVLVGSIIIIVASYILKNPLSVYMYTHLPFFKFDGLFRGVTALNIIVYELVAFITVFAALFVIYKIVCFITKIADKLLSLIFFIGIPNKILGAVLGFVQSILILYFVIAIFKIGTSINGYEMKPSLADVILDVPILKQTFGPTLDSLADITSLAKEYEYTKDKGEFNNEVIDILLEYNVITEENLDKIIDSGKITIYEEGDEDNAEDAE